MSDFDFEAALRAQIESSEEPAISEEEAVAEEPESEEEAVLETEESGEEEETEEPVVEEEEQPRDEAGRFVPKDESARSYLSNHGDDVEQALRSAAEREQLMGRQAQEIGDLRKAVDDLRSSLSAEEPPGDEEIVENPSSAAMWALQNRDFPMYQRAMAEWSEMDPWGAMQFHSMIQVNALRDELTQKVEPVLAPAMQQRNIQELRAVQSELQGVYPDLMETLNAATDADVQGFPESLSQQMRDGDVSQKRDAILVLYRWIKANRPQAATASARQAKKEAAVATSSSSPARETKDLMERLAEEMLTPEPHSVLHGLQR